jgi:protein TonB
MQAAYPVAARREGLEANVDLRVLVDAEGRVSEVQVVRAAGSGFDEAAVRLVKKFRFAAGVSEGKAVAMWINWTYKFRLDG